MPKFLDLATELVLAITSHIPRSTDNFQLVLVNRKLYHMIIPQLYKDIMLGQTRDPSNKSDFTEIRGDTCWDTVRLRRLCIVLKNQPPSDELVVESLCLELNSNTLHDSFQLSDIMLYLPSLKSFCLRGRRSALDKGGLQPSRVSLSTIGEKLRNVSGTLESLILDIDEGVILCEGCVGSLSCFSALKHLSIQSHVFFDSRGVFVISRLSDHDYTLRYDEAILARSLPPRLQKLQMSCWADGYQEDNYAWGPLLTIHLEDLFKWRLDTLPELQDITVYYPTENYRADGVKRRFVVQEVEPVFMGDELELSRYADKGLMQKVAKTLTEMALEQDRNVSVKFERASQEGSRAWGEPVTEPAKVGS